MKCSWPDSDLGVRRPQVHGCPSQISMNVYCPRHLLVVLVPLGSPKFQPIAREFSSPSQAHVRIERKTSTEPKVLCTFLFVIKQRVVPFSICSESHKVTWNTFFVCRTKRLSDALRACYLLLVRSGLCYQAQFSRINIEIFRVNALQIFNHPAVDCSYKYSL